MGGRGKKKGCVITSSGNRNVCLKASYLNHISSKIYELKSMKVQVTFVDNLLIIWVPFNLLMVSSVQLFVIGISTLGLGLGKPFSPPQKETTLPLPIKLRLQDGDFIHVSRALDFDLDLFVCYIFLVDLRPTDLSVVS